MRMTTLITGASSGIGEAIARECAKRGDRLFLCGRDRGRLDAVAAACRADGATADATVVDVTDREAVERWIREADAASPLDRVFANAGVATGAETEEHVRNTFAINVGGTVNTVLPAIELMRARRRGQIVLTASIAGYRLDSRLRSAQELSVVFRHQELHKDMGALPARIPEEGRRKGLRHLPRIHPLATDGQEHVPDAVLHGGGQGGAHDHLPCRPRHRAHRLPLAHAPRHMVPLDPPPQAQ